MLFYRLNFNDGTYITMLTPEAMNSEISGGVGDITISVLPKMYVCIRGLDTVFSLEKTDLLGNVWKFELVNDRLYWIFNGNHLATFGTLDTGFYYLAYKPDTGEIALDCIGTPTVPQSNRDVTFALNGNTNSLQYPTIENCVTRCVDYVLSSTSTELYGGVFDIRDTTDFYPVRDLTLYMVSGRRPRTFYEFFRLASPNGTTSGYINLGDLSDTISVLSDVPDPYEYGGDSGTSEMTGDFDDTSDPIDFPDLPLISAVDTGFITLYNPNLAQLKSLANYMWDSNLFDVATWQKIFANPMDGILALSIIPVNVPDGNVVTVTVGNISTNVQMTKASQQYVELDCGTLNVNEYWSAYLDYEPHTKCEIYLPYCGTHQLSVDDIMNKPVHVKYHVDILSGGCVAYVKCGESVLYEFSGQCATMIPISAQDFGNVISSAVSVAVSVGSMVASGGATAPLAIPTLANTALNGGLKPNIEKSGAVSGVSGLLAIQKPYLILTRPKQAHPEKQSHYTGYPSFITEKLSTLSGYTEIEKIHLENVPATDEELTEIETLLKGGVIL